MEYDARRGVHGKYADRYRALYPDSAEILQVWAPLFGFRWAGSEHQVSPNTWIRPHRAYRGYDETPAFKYAVSEEERERCGEVGHWLSFTHTRSDRLSTRVKVNSFLLTLWIVRPTRTNVPFRFEVAEPDFRLFARVVDRFQWVHEQAQEEITDDDLHRLTGLLPALRTVYTTSRRLKTALALTFRACVASEWQSAFVCFASAAEAILTCSSGPGLTSRLAGAYARVVAPGGIQRKAAEENFKRLYAARSDIVHGRVYERQDPTRNIDDLTEFADMIRAVWARILESHELSSALEGDDRQRRALFLKL